ILKRQPKAIWKPVDDVSFEIRRGETLSLVGESGCGKSTTARILVGLYKPTFGTVEIAGSDLAKVKGQKAKEVRGKIQMIFQDPYASLNPRWNVGKIVAEPIHTQKTLTNRKEIQERVDSVLRLVNLSPDDKAKYPHQFSGGQRQRISIARAIAVHPEFLVCDEPTSALDVSVQAQVLNLMKNLQLEIGLTYLFISHNLSVVHHISDRVGVMYLGRLVELADKKTLFDNPNHPYTQMLLDAVPNIKGTGRKMSRIQGEVPNPLNPPTGCSFHPRCPHAFERCRRERPEMKPININGSIAYVCCHAVEEGRI
ncbi:MAG: ATP-binding cassette domain-containing protein, partial [Burkholderiales bacterium]|nr:ATP-binding cassette domain-containing protein [Burkholderiales bacterium]